MKSSIYMNEAEAIFETFWDSGDTYPNHQKFDRMKNYDMHGDGEYKITWNGVQVFTYGSFILSRNLELDITNFDILSLKTSVPDGMNIIVRAMVDGVLTELIKCTEATRCGEFEGNIKGKRITYIELEFIKVGNISSCAVLFWLSLANYADREKMLNRENGFRFPDCWDGCFRDDFEIKPHLSAYFSEKELENIRNKVKSGMCFKAFSELEQKANEFIKFEPEKYIGEFVTNDVGVLGRNRNVASILRGKFMTVLAFVGLVKKDKEMLKMACRMALSVSCCDKWTEGYIGSFPGTTFHHRSFLEGELSLACAKVLDWAGEALTWHGRNIIYDAIIMKGFPRLEADIYTMDYIWYMNQGIVFAGFFIQSLLAVAKRYPRYAPLIDKYEADLLQMWENYVTADGGSSEGPAYWDYSASNFMVTLYYVAKYRGKPLSAYVPDSLRKSELYAKGVLSTTEDGTYLIAFNDTPHKLRFSLATLTFFAQAGIDKKYWSSVLNYAADNFNNATNIDTFLIMSNGVEDVEIAVNKEGYTPMTSSGFVSLARNNSETGNTFLFVQGGLSEAGGHEHEDKGSFVIEAEGKTILSDRGYARGKDALAFSSAKWHNLLYPELKNESHQVTGKEDCYGKFLKAEYKDNLFECVLDVASAWEGIFEKNIRTIISPDPNLFIIHDSIRCNCDVSFRLNSYGKIHNNVIDINGVKLYIHTLNWTPYKVTDDIEGTDAYLKPVNLIKLYGKPGELVTVLELAKGKSKAFIEGNKLTYGNILIEYSNGQVNIR